MNRLIIHVTGPVYVDYFFYKWVTSLNTIKTKIRDNIIIKNLDDLRNDFIKEFYSNKNVSHIDESEYQTYIDKYINSHTGLLIFCGNNMYTINGKNKKLYYILHSNYNYYKQIDNEYVITQECIHFLDIVENYIIDKRNNLHNKKYKSNDIIKYNDNSIKKINDTLKHECDIGRIIKENNKLKKYYKKKGYIFMSEQDIYDDIIKLLNNIM